ncbi:MAG: deoxyribonuclease IV [Bryobacteraceae bacterium]
MHTSLATSLENAALKASELGANTFQIFSSSPRMWRASSPSLEQILQLRRARERLDLHPLAIHANYLVNLASPDPLIRSRSIASFRAELQRAAAIGAEYLVLHPGSYKGQSLEEGIAALVLGLRDAAAGAAGIMKTSVTVLLENTVGCGSQIGGRFEELRAIRDQAAALTDVPLGYCLDTCHLLAAGYDISSAAGLRETILQAESVLGIDHVELIHANDSKTPLGSHVDRHANIGEGHIGKAGFRRILAHPKLRSKPFILETPVEEDGDDRRNLENLKKLASPRVGTRHAECVRHVENLKKLCPKSRTTTTRSS